TARAVDVYCEMAALRVVDPKLDDLLGSAVAISGDVAVVASHQADDNGSSSGSVQVYRFDGVNWRFAQELRANDAAMHDEFGSAVAIDGAVMIVGAIGDDDGGSGSGSAYVFRYVGGSWTQEAKLRASDAEAGDEFGFSVSISGDAAIVGAPFNDGVDASSGAAYVFRRTAGAWAEEQKLTAFDAAGLDQFGRAVGVAGDLAVAGAFRDDDDGESSGSAYVYRFDAGTWADEDKLTATDAMAGDRFGGAVSVNADRILVGSLLDDDTGLDSGSAYVFRDTGVAWVQEQKLRGPGGAAGDQMGTSVGLDGDRAIVGAPLRGADDSGAAYAFKRSGMVWTALPTLVGSDTVVGDHFGMAVGISGLSVVIGGPMQDLGADNAGAGYLFTTGDDCNLNLIPDACDIASDFSRDGDGNRVPDECEPGGCCFDAADICVEGVEAGDCDLIQGRFLGRFLTCDSDPDGDTAFGCDDGCPLDGNKATPGACGCGVADADMDGDGVADCLDLCAGTAPGVLVDAMGCPRLGACCFAVGVCLPNQRPNICAAIMGFYRGDNTVCNPGCRFADCNDDGIVTLADYGQFHGCLSGQVNGCCGVSDANGDGRLDLIDWRAFQVVHQNVP
ncbi:MAG: hypothetical protein HOP29_19005, partial [Phycisphaerales bacterium]|nr:hypothetical protein [Phycisphaerales bacterium]